MELQREELEKLYAETFRGLRTGTVLMGTVVQVKKEGIIVNIGTKSEGFVPTSEFSAEECRCLKPGDEIEIHLLRGSWIVAREATLSVRSSRK